MSAPRPSLLRFATAVVGAELSRAHAKGDTPGAGHEARVAERIMIRLHEHLGKLIGPAGFDVLLARSLVLARRAHPSLSGCVAGAGGHLSWPEEPGGADRASVERGAVGILSHFFELLAVLIGEDLTMRLASDVWPGLPDAGPAGDET